MSDQTLRAMLYVAACFSTMLIIRVVYVMVFYKSWTTDELFGFCEGGWETERMRTARRDFWR